MSYQVIARKYRPRTFADLIGQEHITRTLGNALDQQRLHHAFIFSGARGTGKTTTARILARGLNCRTGITSRPCLKCASCLEIAAGNSIDVLEIDAASNTGVDNVRDVIINNIAVAPARDRYKIFVIDEVHMLSNNAFNALLKTLEEPPSHVVFIMATTELHKIPDTILSRCQQFEFRHIPVEKMVQRLREIAQTEQVSISDQGLREIARAGAGSLRDAFSAFDQVIAFSGSDIGTEDVISALGLAGEQTLLSFTEAVAAQDSAAILRLVEELDSRGYDLRNFTRELMSYMRHLLVIKSGVTSSAILDVSEVEAETLRRLAARFSEEDLVRFFHLLAATEKEIRDSPHPRFQLEIGLIRLTHAVRLRSLDQLISRLEALETRLTGGGITFSNPGAAPAPGQQAPPRPQSSAPRSTAPGAAETRVKETPPAKSSASEPDFPPVMLEEPPGFSESFDSLSSFDGPEADERVPPRRVTGGNGSGGAAQAAPGRAPVEKGREAQAVCAELERLNRHALVTALEDAQSINYDEGRLIVTMPQEDILARRLRDSSAIFSEIGQRLFGQPMRIEVLISGQSSARIDEAAEAKARLREEALKIPAVRLLVEKFRGEVTDVREATK
ncbi:MAG TPA: DNA polymerase III subunit gamma/tau [Blastocatellia bacterium]|nr:DNA polymerase III subunit gamma/tau [Blastocatellia bacterium]